MQITKNGIFTVMSLSINEKTCSYKFKINLVESRIKNAQFDDDRNLESEVFLNMISFNK